MQCLKITKRNTERFGMVIEIKSLGIVCENGEWFHESTFDGSRIKMKRSPFAQVRTNFYALQGKLAGTSLGNDILGETACTYTLWFPDITWTGPMPPDAPNSAFILDLRHLKNTETSSVVFSANHIRRPNHGQNTTWIS
jgi:hypothetical protein